MPHCPCILCQLLLTNLLSAQHCFAGSFVLRCLDICENCYATFQTGTLPHVNKLNQLNRDPTAHAFAAYVDGKAFEAMAGVNRPQPKVNKTKVKPNDRTCRMHMRACCYYVRIGTLTSWYEEVLSMCLSTHCSALLLFLFRACSLPLRQWQEVQEVLLGERNWCKIRSLLQFMSRLVNYHSRRLQRFLCSHLFSSIFMMDRVHDRVNVTCNVTF